MNTDTPRTDEAAVDVWRKSNGERMETSSDKVDADFARRLERERDEWKAKYIDLKSQLTQTHGCVTISRNGYVQELERELAEAREETIRTREFMDYGFAKAQEELATVTEQRDRLAVALKETISGYDVVTESIPSLCSDYVHNVITPLLSAVKE